MKRKALKIVKGAVILGAGSAALSGIGGATAGYGATALGSVGRALPVAGTAIGAGMVLGAVRQLQPGRRKRRII